MLGHQHKQIIYILVAIFALILLIACVVVVLKTCDATANRRYPNYAGAVIYSHCSEKPLNRPQQQAFNRLGIQFIPPAEIINLAQQSTGDLKHIIYIPCSYNNSDWDIQEFLKDFGPKPPTLKSTQRRPVIITAAVLGCNKLCSKNGLWSVLEKTYRREMAKTITPESWVIPAESMQFKTLLNTRANNSLSLSLATSAPSAFILKKNIQGKRGLLLSNSRDTLLGLLSAPNDYAVAQYYLPNPYLIHGRKLNIRLYILITISKDSTRPRWWLYTKGKCIYTNREYKQLPKNTTIKSETDQDLPLLEQHFTSLNLETDRVYSQDHCPESLAELQEYMSGRWENWPQIWQKIQLGLRKVSAAYLDKLSKPKLAQKAYQIFGADYIISADPKTGKPREPYLLEFNKGPEMKYKSPQDPELKSGLQTDILELVLGSAETTTNVNPGKWILLNSANKSKATRQQKSTFTK